MFPSCFYGHRFIQYQTALKSKRLGYLGYLSYVRDCCEITIQTAWEMAESEWISLTLRNSILGCFPLERTPNAEDEVSIIMIITSKHNPERPRQRESVHRFYERICPA